MVNEETESQRSEFKRVRTGSEPRWASHLVQASFWTLMDGEGLHFLGLGHPRLPAQRHCPGHRAAGSGLSFSNRLPSLSVKPPMSCSHGVLSNSAELIQATPASNLRVRGANEAGTPLCPDHSLGQGGLGHSNCYDLAVWGSEMYLQPHKP